MSYTLQAVALAIAPKITGSLSVVGSLFIITDILKSKEKRGRTYSRVILALTMYDMLTAIAQFMSTWPIPRGSPQPFASGTTFTCSFQGFFTQLGVGAPMYNCSLSFYYLIVIAFAFPEARIKQIEWFLLGIPLAFSLSTAIAGLPLTLYNNAGLWCWIAALPGSCENGDNKWGDGPCIRGEYAWIYRWAIYYGEVWFCILTVTFNMTAVTYLVWAKEKASLKFKFGHRANNSSTNSHATNNSHGSEPGASSVGSANARDRAGFDGGSRAFSLRRSGRKARQQERQGLASQVFWQAFYYVLGFYLTWICPTLFRMLQTLQKPVPYWIRLTMAILLPFQGFLNFLVYMRPRVVQYQKQHPEMSIFGAVCRAFHRTFRIFQFSDSGNSSEHERQDVDVLDPCYALQRNREEEDQLKRETRNLKDAALAGILAKECIPTTIDDSPLSSSSLELRRADELKLLSEENPSFYEEKDSLELVMELNDDDDSTAEGVYRNEKDSEPTKGSDQSKSLPPAMESAPEQATRQPSVGRIEPELGAVSDSAEPLERNQAEGEEMERQLINHLKRTNLYFYPEFTSEPDFFFL